MKDFQLSLFSFSALPPLTLYIHVPWCLRKCPYCDFNSHATSGAMLDDMVEKEYLAALIADLEQDLPAIWGRTVDSIFFGGGTPSLLSAQGLEQLLSDVRARVNLQPDVEITLEANPGTFEQQKFRDFHAAGINRLSIGVQSFNDAQLRALGRVHDAAEAGRACELAREAGFDNINIDLMFGLPGQMPAAALADITQAVALQPDHLSYYQLTIEPNTLFHARPPRLPDDERIWNMQQQAQQLLSGHGYQHYEVSAWAKPGRQCHHNMNYWQFGDYLGIGAGAHSKLTDANQQHIVRFTKPRQPRDYIEYSCSARPRERQRLGRDDAALEFMMNALRLQRGFPAALFFERTGLPLSNISEVLRQAEEKGLLSYDIKQICPTELGRRHLNSLLELFMPG